MVGHGTRAYGGSSSCDVFHYHLSMNPPTSNYSDHDPKRCACIRDELMESDLGSSG